jgi:SAM-dependent methyltransferase
MDAQKTDKRFYEKKWMSIGDWDRQKAPYLKKSAGIEALISLDWIKHYLKEGALIDIGCGAGRNAVLFSKNGFRAFGIDFSAKAIRLAKILNDEEKGSAAFRCQSILDLNAESDFFDLAADYGCFHHLRKSQWNKYLKNLLRLLKEKSYYLLYCFSMESGQTINHKKGRNYSYRSHHYNHYFSLIELKKIFNKDFKIIRHKIIREKERILAFNLVLFQRK